MKLPFTKRNLLNIKQLPPPYWVNCVFACCRSTASL